MFFPIVHSNHYYLVCFNMKNPEFIVIDNDSDALTFDKKYKGVPEILVSVIYMLSPVKYTNHI